MANYIARVELHKASDDDYEELHDEMSKRGFTRTIKGDNGSTYHLPTGTYAVANSSVMLQTACDAAIEAAKETGKAYSLIVADWGSAQWAGLPTV
ncbi:MAG TPA: type V toxin-antitoxin system endoribonuclease antitoxin GhoS [Candidatus Dormibacteraeota bacterium]|nr:type V toxin-antitoxin system endoribonuclease antitoxin GhoS [Candidatus Dormibacteraeota bacterium]